MTPRERFETIINGGKPDKIPAVMRLEPWYNHCVSTNTLPDELKGKTIEQVEDYLGFGRSARKGRVFEERLGEQIKCTTKKDSSKIITQWETSVGTLQMVQRHTPEDIAAGLIPTIIEHPIKTKDDYAAYKQIVSNIEFVPTYEQFEKYDHQIGDAGLPMAMIGANPFHLWLVKWVGYEQGYMHLFDFPDVVEEAIEIANRKYLKMWEIVANSPAKFMMYGVNFDTSTTSPPIFKKYFLPHLKAFNELIHSAGKRNACHADGDMSGLLDMTVEAGFDVADCFACHPFVRCTMEQARKVWKNQITIWGGIPSNMLDYNTPIEYLHKHLEQIYQAVKPGDRFILAISDQAMPSASWEHIKLVSQWACEHADYPLQ